MSNAGRPTKYEGQATIKKLEAITESLSLKDFLTACSIDHIATAMGVCRDTIYEWQKQHPEFSDTVKRWEAKRGKLFYTFAFGKQMSPAVWIFLAKNWLGLTDRQEHFLQGKFEHSHRVTWDDMLKAYEEVESENTEAVNNGPGLDEGKGAEQTNVEPDNGSKDGGSPAGDAQP